jgi:predicted glutamine amidotransferase
VCRVLAYLGDPIPLHGPLFETENSLVTQSVAARLMSLLNIGGFGLTAWDANSPDPGRPYTYRTPGVPVFDRNLSALAEKVQATAAIAHVRGVIYDPSQTVGPQNLHPFRFPDAAVALAQNGDLYGFGDMRYDMLDHVDPALARLIEGTTDTEWVYALLLSQLDNPFGRASADELVDAVTRTLTILRDLRERRGIATQSPVNLVLGDGDSLVATRFCFDYGWYPDDDSFFAGEREFDFTTLWYTFGERYVPDVGGWRMQFGERHGAALVVSEPLGSDTSQWFEAPEYSMLVLTRGDDGVTVDIQELDL